MRESSPSGGRDVVSFIRSEGATEGKFRIELEKVLRPVLENRAKVGKNEKN